ncbi:hypothetical protein J6590_092161 [Homalodisca vitripennis]|nr:hypothetical protein J6590_092161 [Homalodisca vitripennis]
MKQVSDISSRALVTTFDSMGPAQYAPVGAENYDVTVPGNSAGNVKCDKRVITRKSLVDIKKVTKKNQYGETKLHILCQRRNSSIAEIQSALAMPETDVNAKDNNGYTPLHKAVIYASVLKTKLLLQHQILLGKSAVDIGAQNKAGSTPLHEAVRVKSLELCKLLVDHGGKAFWNASSRSLKNPF